MFSVFCLATLEIISVGAGLVKMLGVEAELFVTIDDSGVVRATVSNLCIANSVLSLATLLAKQAFLANF
jgi:hypothetical protein